MTASLLESLSGLVTPELIGKAAATFGDNEAAVSKGFGAALPLLLGSVAGRASDTNFASTLFSLVRDPANDGSLLSSAASLLGANASSSPMMALGGKFLSALFGSNLGSLGNALAGHAGVKPATASSMLGMAAPLVLSILGKSVKSGNLNAGSLAALLMGQKHQYAAALPNALSKLESYFAAPAAAAFAAPAVPAAKSSIWRWLVPLLLALAALWMLSRCVGHKEQTVETAPPVATPVPQVAAPPAPGATAVSVPSAKVYFDVGTADLPADAGAVLAPVVAYLQANPSSMAVVAGFNDPTGDPVANEELAKNRAEAIKGALVAGGVSEARIDMQKPVVTAAGGPLDEARRVEVTVR